MNIALKHREAKVQEDLEQDAVEACFNDEHGSPLVDILDMASLLQCILVTVCTGPVSTFTGKQRRTASRVGGDWCTQPSPTKARVVGRLSNSFNPNFGDKGFDGSLAKWEDDLLKYEKETQPSRPSSKSSWREGLGPRTKRLGFLSRPWRTDFPERQTGGAATMMFCVRHHVLPRCGFCMPPGG